ncbi:Os04g0453950, partial [Oryza sativa Japonica Group]
HVGPTCHPLSLSPSLLYVDGPERQPEPCANAGAAVEDANKHWAPHGAVLTAFVVGINLLMVLLVFFYFWRFFSGKRGPPSSSSMAGGADDEEASSSDTSHLVNHWPDSSRAIHGHFHSIGWLLVRPDAARAPAWHVHLPVRVPPAAAGPDAAVRVDLARLLPRCGHRFHVPRRLRRRVAASPLHLAALPRHRAPPRRLHRHRLPVPAGVAEPEPDVGGGVHAYTDTSSDE